MVIPIATGGSGMGLLTPGDRADVILTQTFHDNDTPLTRRSVSETVVESLRVLAIDVGDVKGVIPVNAPVRSVTLEVTPQQAEKINVAIELGKLSLTLRAVGDSGTSVAQEPDNGVKPEWAADVSPALRAASVPVAKPVATDNSVVRVMRGGASETAKPQ
jgi:pilus assembly protein CpaB